MTVSVNNMKTIPLALCCLVSTSAWSIDSTPASSERSVVVVLGDVRKPGKILWTPGLTVSKAVTMCGGPGWRYPRRGFIIRDAERIAVRPAAIDRGKEPDVKLHPGDTLDLNPPGSLQTSK